MIGQSFNKLDNKEGLEVLFHALRKNSISSQFVRMVLLFVSVFALPARFEVREDFGERAFSIMIWISCLIIQLLPPSFLIVLEILALSDDANHRIGWIGWTLIGLSIIFSPFTWYMRRQIIRGVEHFADVLHCLDNSYSYSKDRGFFSRDFDFNLVKMPEHPKWGFNDSDYKQIFIEPFNLVANGIIIPIILTVLGGILWCFKVYSRFMREWIAPENTAITDELMRSVDWTVPQIMLVNLIAGALTVATYFIISGIALLIEELGVFFNNRSIALDMLDAHYEMQYVEELKASMEKPDSERANPIVFNEVVIPSED